MTQESNHFRVEKITDSGEDDTLDGMVTTQKSLSKLRPSVERCRKKRKNLIHILYEDNHLIVVNKPPGFLSQDSPLESTSMESLLKQFLKKRDQKPGNVFLGTLFRLDRPVSGILVFAKTSKALSRMNEIIRNREVKKTYVALIEGWIKQKTGCLENWIAKEEFISKIKDKAEPHTQQARLYYTCISQFRTGNAQCSQLEIVLDTGRYHQIRAQFSAIGHPIVGDIKYGSTVSCSQKNGIALHHFRYECVHPIKKEKLVWEAPLPDGWMT